MSVSDSAQWAWKSDINAEGNDACFWRRSRTAAASCGWLVQRRFQPERKELHFEEERNGCVIDRRQGGRRGRPLVQRIRRLLLAGTKVHWFWIVSSSLACYYYTLTSTSIYRLYHFLCSEKKEKRIESINSRSRTCRVKHPADDGRRNHPPNNRRQGDTANVFLTLPNE